MVFGQVRFLPVALPLPPTGRREAYQVRQLEQKPLPLAPFLANVTNPKGRSTFMTDNDDFNDDADTSGDGSAAKTLRQQRDKLAREKAALETELNTFRQAQKTSTISEALKAAGGKASWAKYVTVDGDVTPEAVRKWLETEGAEAFDWTPPEADEPDEAEAANREGAKRVAQATRNAPPGDSAWTPERMKTASLQEIFAAGVFKK